MSLSSMQREFQQWLTCESAGISTCLGDRARAGLAVYLNNYRAQLMACLASSFPAAREYLGGSVFDSAAATHIEAMPPHAWTLDAYAAGFPATLERLHSPLSGELARLELGLATAFVGPDADPVDTTRLQDVDWDAAVLQLAPTFALLPVTSDVGALWSALLAQRTPPAELRLPATANVAIWRRGFEPRFRTLAAEEAEALEQIRMRWPYGEVCRDMVGRMGEGPGVARAGAMLAQWLADGLIVGVASHSPAEVPKPGNHPESRTRESQQE